MAEELEKAPESTELQPAPKPVENPRNAILADIAKTAFAQHDADAAENAKVLVQHDDGSISEPAAAPSEADASPPPEGAAPLASSPEEPAAAAPAEEQPPTPAPKPGEEVIDPEKDYEIVVEGQKVTVKGRSIIDAGYRTFQKETAADFRLRTASQLLEEAERRVAATKPAEEPAPRPTPSEEVLDGAKLAEDIQFGTKEQAAAAIQKMIARGVEPNRILQLAGDSARAAVRDELEFARGKAFIHREFGDVLAKEPLRHLFFSEEGRLRDAGDKRPYVELYADIGNRIRKDFNLTKPAASPQPAQPGTLKAREAAKKAAPSVPRTAAARLAEQPAAKPKTPSEIIADMQAKRGQHRLTTARKE